jgi:hemerythrin
MSRLMMTKTVVWFPWKDEYSVQLQEIDTQHKRLVQMVNDLQDAMASGQGRAVLGRILDELISYTRTHFAAEERIMQQCGYPDLSQHQEEHRDLATKVSAFRNEFQAGRAAITVQLMQFLKNWLTSHIMGSDQRYSPYLRQK